MTQTVLKEQTPRRIDTLRWTPAERAIGEAVRAVEAMDADVRLTDAVVLLGAARERVADFVDGVEGFRTFASQQPWPDPPSSWSAHDRSWALSALLARIDDLELARVIRTMSVEDIDRFAAVVAGFQAQIREQSPLPVEGASDGE